jgi:hypothetical protein
MQTDNLTALAAHLRDPLSAPHFRLGAAYLAPLALPDADGNAPPPPPISSGLLAAGGLGGIDVHALALSGQDDPEDGDTLGAAANWLEIDLFTVKQLCHPPSVADATAAQAAQVVAGLVETGEVDWTLAATAEIEPAGTSAGLLSRLGA